MEDWSIEMSRSNRASCKKCRKKIDSNILRWIYYTTDDRYNNLSKSFYHYDCGRELIKKELHHIEKIINDGDYLKKQYEDLVKQIGKTK